MWGSTHITCGDVVQSNPIQSFVDHGYLHLPAFHARKRLDSLRQRIIDTVERSSLHADGFKALRKLPFFQQITRLSAVARISGLHDTLVTPELKDLMVRASARPALSVHETQLLLSPPDQGQWTLSGLKWHVDLAAGRSTEVPGVQAFFLLDDVAPHGGGTLALAGSHTGANRTGLMAALRNTSQADLEKELGTLGTRIIEMSGRAGDVYLMDLRTLHTPSINSAKRMRMMATCRAFA